MFFFCVFFVFFLLFFVCCVVVYSMTVCHDLYSVIYVWVMCVWCFEGFVCFFSFVFVFCCIFFLI